MDNLGEAADIHRGLHPPDKPLGSHISLTTLPLMLDLLKQNNIKATYFIEGWNNTHYPEIIRDVASQGHEIGFHAWQHEVWKSLDAETEVSNLDKSCKDLEGVFGKEKDYRGFRPPGGLVTDRTLALMKERGFTYLSPAARRCAVVDGVAMVPFRWEDIDAYYYLPSMSVVRERNGDGEECLGPEAFKKRLLRRVDELCRDGGYAAFLFHPFLTLDEERLRVMGEVLEEVRRRDELWVATCAEVAEWVTGNETAFGSNPEWDLVEWKKK